MSVALSTFAESRMKFQLHLHTPLAATDLRNAPSIALWLLGGSFPCAASAFGRFAELPRQAFRLLFAESLPASGAKIANQS
jgi:hypothetical protein